MTDDKPNREPRWSVKIGLAVASAVLAYLLVLLVARLASGQLGIHDREFRYENEIGMWQDDPELGFFNQPEFSDYCFGTVQVTTNAAGFRGQGATSVSKTGDELRIIGIGDSVMWGTCVDQSESFLGRLQARLASPSRSVEVINAGVVGYSTLQEQLLLQRLLPEYSPDLVIVNFCENDLLPTEDPFGSVRRVYLDHIADYLAEAGETLSSVEQSAIDELVQVFESSASVHEAMARVSPASGQMAIRLFLELPIARMVGQARAQQAELLYLLIPPRDDQRVYRQLVGIVKRVLDANEAAYLDLGRSLHTTRISRPEGIPVAEPSPGILSTLEQNWLPDVRLIKLVRQTNKIHLQQNYIDHVHPSRKGNEIIAEAIAEWVEKHEEL